MLISWSHCARPLRAVAQESSLTEAANAQTDVANSDGLPANPFEEGAAVEAPTQEAESEVTFAASPSQVEAAEVEPGLESDEGPPWDVRASVAWISAGRFIEPRDSAANPGNATFRIPSLGAQTELRPSLRLDYGSLLSFVAQPRFMATADLTRVSGEYAPMDRDVRVSILQLYASLQINDSVGITYGYQNFQWGPAELVSPSNRLFPIVNFQRDPLFVVPGRNLVRVNVSAGKSLSLVILGEVLPSDQVTFQAREPFRRQGLAKLEAMRDDGSAYLGLIAGAGDRVRPWFGEYGSVALTDAWSLYCDASHTQGSRVLRPVRQPDDTTRFEQPWANARRLRTLSDCGTSFAFEQGTELRAEYVYNDAGYSRSELREATRSVMHPPSLAGAADAYVAPGLQVLAEHAAYASIRVPELPPSRRLTLVGRYLWSVTDHSGSAFAVLTVDATDAWVLFASALATHGPRYGENSRFISGGVIAGATYSM